MTISHPLLAPATTKTEDVTEVNDHTDIPRLMRAANDLAHRNITLSKAARGKKLLFLTMGSRGDVQPFAALALGLQRAGFVVSIMSNENHIPFLQDFGLHAVASHGDAEAWMHGEPEFLKSMADGDIWKIMGTIAERNKKEFPEVLRRELQEIEDFAPDAILYSTLEGTQANAVSYVRGIPAIPCDLFVMQASGSENSWADEPLWLPRFVHLALAAVFRSLFVVGEKDGKHDELKKRLPGCEPGLSTSVFQDADFLKPSVPILCGVSPSIVPSHSDWTTRPMLTGFWVVPEKEQCLQLASGNKNFGASDIDRLNEFFAAGDTPAYIGWGSMLAVSSQHMATLAVRSLKCAKMRGVILGGWAKLDPENLTDQPDSEELLDYANKNIIFVKSAPHEWLFPRCCAIVHHGGVGTTAAGLRSGRPSIVTPCGFDQFKNARMVAASGAGLALPRVSKVKPEAIAEALKRATTETKKGGLVETARNVGLRLRSEDGIGEATKILDEFFEKEIESEVWKMREERRRQQFRSRAESGILRKMALLAGFVCCHNWYAKREQTR